MNKNHILITVAFVIVSFVLGYKFDSITGKHSKHAENVLQRPRVAMFPFNIQPNDSQKKELERIDDKYADKIMNARNAMANIITPDQRKARMEAAQKAQKEGKKGKDFMDAIQQSMHMTPDQEKKMKDTQTELIDLSKQMQEEIQKLLTEDQKKEMNDRIKALSQNRPVPMPGGSLQPRTPGKQAAGKPEPKTEKTPAAHGKKKS